MYIYGNISLSFHRMRNSSDKFVEKKHILPSVLFSPSKIVPFTRLCDEIQGVYKRMMRFLKINKKFISHLTRAKRAPSAAATVQVSHALPAVRFSCLMRGHGASFQDGVAAGKGFLCAPF